VPHNLNYDYLVIAVALFQTSLVWNGWRSFAFNFRTLVDAVRIEAMLFKSLNCADKERIQG